MFRYVIISAAVVIVSNAANAKDLTAAEQLAADLSAKTGLSFEVGYARMGTTAAARRPTTQPRPVFVTSRQSSYSNNGGCFSVTGCPSLVDVSATLPGYHSKLAPPPGPGAFSEKIEARGYRMFPDDSKREERMRWMAKQEQIEIANEINHSKPLIYPAR